MNHSEETKKKFKFRAGAVYAVLALCVAGVGIATWYSTSAKLLPNAQNETTTEGITAKIAADELTTVPDRSLRLRRTYPKTRHLKITGTQKM